MTCQVSLLSDYGDLLQLREEWPRSPVDPNPTRTFSWFEAFWYQMAPYGQVVCARAAGAQGSPAFLPFFAERRSFFGIKVWSLDAVARSEAFIQAAVEPDAVAAVAAELFRIHGPRCFLRLRLQVAEGATARALALLRGARTVAIPREMCPVIRIRPGVTSYAEIVSSAYRRRLARDLRRLHQAGAVELRTSFCARDFTEALRIDQRSWKHDQRSDLVSSRHSHVLYRLYAEAAAADGSLRLFFLFLDGQAIAFLYAARIGNTAWLLKGSYDQQHTTLRPIVLLFTHAIDALIAEGVEVIDLWGRADRFKMHWATDYIQRCDEYVFPDHPAMRPVSFWLRKRAVRPLVLPQELERERG